jgi:pyruvate/2-oxoglutarate dehydrogenase complex dihydrolipoamide dehydrogenase (E3) component
MNFLKLVFDEHVMLGADGIGKKAIELIHLSQPLLNFTFPIFGSDIKHEKRS